jgi:DNA-binding winged helix-turn-helix (wHTH) protein
MSLIAKEIYEFGPFLLDPTERILSCDGTIVSLTSKAFEILLCLVRSQGRVLTNDELLRQLWPDTFVEEVNLAANISTVRKALRESPQDCRFIATVPGRGYRFVAEVRRVAEIEGKNPSRFGRFLDPGAMGGGLKQAIITALVLLLAVPIGLRFWRPVPVAAPPTWAYVQSAYTGGCSGTSCAVPLVATTAGSVLVAGTLDLNAAGHTISSATGGGGTWALCPESGCLVTQSPQFSLDMAYNITGTGGAKSVTVTLDSADSNWTAIVDEWKCTASCGTIALDQIVSKKYTSALCSTDCLGAGFTGLTGTSDLIVSLVDRTQEAGVPSSPYVYDTTAGQWIAYAPNITSGAAPTLPLKVVGVFAATGLAFK